MNGEESSSLAKKRKERKERRRKIFEKNRIEIASLTLRRSIEAKAASVFFDDLNSRIIKRFLNFRTDIDMD